MVPLAIRCLLLAVTERLDTIGRSCIEKAFVAYDHTGFTDLVLDERFWVDTTRRNGG